MEEFKPKEIDTPTGKMDELKKVYNKLYNEITSTSTDDIRKRNIQEMQALYGSKMALELGGIAKPILEAIAHSNFDYTPDIRLIQPFIKRNIDLWLSNQQLDKRNKEYIKTLFDLSYDSVRYANELLEERNKIKEKLEQEKNKLSEKDLEEQRKKEELEIAKAIPIPNLRKNELEEWYDTLPLDKSGQMAYLNAANPKKSNLSPNDIEYIKEINRMKHKWLGKLTKLAPLAPPPKKEKPNETVEILGDLPKPLDN